MFLFISLISLTLPACGDDDDENDDDPAVSESSIVGKWGISGVIDGDYVTSTMTFKADGTVIVEEKFRDYPEENYKVTLNYTINGNLATGAQLTMSGRDADGDYLTQTYEAKISGNKLSLHMNGEDTMILTRQ